MNPYNIPFFIVGTGRSGTTLFRNLLRIHPEIYIPRETHWLPIIWNEFGNRSVSYEEIIRLVDRVYMAKGRTPLQRIFLEHKLNPKTFYNDFRNQFKNPRKVSICDFQTTLYGLLAQYQSRRIVGDKTPDYGFCMSMLQLLWPKAKFIHIYRDGRATALSMANVLSFRLLASLGLTHWWSIALDRQYERGLSLAEKQIPIETFFELWDRRFSRIKDECHRIRPESYIEIQYENLLKYPSEILKIVHEFLNFSGNFTWIENAKTLIHKNNVNKYQDRSDWKLLTRKYLYRLKELRLI